MQWRLTHLPELVEKLRGLVKEQVNEADRALIGVGDVQLRRVYAGLQKAKSEWRRGAACSGAKSKRVFLYHPDDGTVEVHRGW